MSISVSVLVPIYNHDGKFVEECLLSLYNQTYSNMEIILIDNEATPVNKQLIRKYLDLDNRMKLVTITKNKGYGYAMNQGLSMAQGEYIGIVESDDYVDNNMFEVLSNIAIKYDLDIVKSSYIKFNSNRNNQETYIYKYPDKILSKYEIVDILFKPISYWTAIYKRSILIDKNIKWSEVKDACGQDVSFFLSFWCFAEKIKIIRDPFYHYRTDNSGQSIYKHNVNAWGSNNNYINLYNYLEHNNITDERLSYIKIREIGNKYSILPFVTKNSFDFYKICANKFKNLDQTTINIFKKFKPKLYKDVSLFSNYMIFFYIKNKLFTSLTFEKHTRLYLLFSLFKYDRIVSNIKIDIFFLPIIRAVSDSKSFRLYLFLLLIFSKFKSKKLKDTTICKFIMGLIRVEINDFICLKILGINIFKLKLKSRSKQNKIDYITNKLSAIEKNLIERKTDIGFNQEYIDIISSYYRAQNFHHVFKKYKDIYKGKDVVLVAGGNSVNFYTPLKEAIHVGVNASFLFDKVNFDYIFLQDLLPTKELQDALINYYPQTCKKFFGYIPFSRFQKCKKVGIKLINDDFVSLSKGYRYYLSDFCNNDWPVDISIEPFKDNNSSVFSALQFILYTHPKRIFLVGCDCTDSDHFYGGKHTYFSKIIPYWKSFKCLVEDRYPDIQICSINPIGLKGIFNDIFTDNFKN